MPQNAYTPFKVSALLALSSLFAGAPAMAQSEPAAVVETAKFMSDYIPTECTVQFGYVEAAATSLTQSFTQNFDQTIDSAIDSQPESICDAVTGTDSGESRNFNFIQAEQGVYKIVTESEGRLDSATANYMFDILGIRFIPINAEGALEASKAQTMFAIEGSTCVTDELEEPYSAFCEFAATDTATGETAVGQMNYLY